MRLAVCPAEQAAGAVFDAVARRIAHRGLRGLDNKLELSAWSAPVPTVATAVGPELMPAEVEREAHLLYLYAAELDAACRLPLAGARPAVAGRRTPAARTRLEQVPDEGLAGTRIHALD